MFESWEGLNTRASILPPSKLSFVISGVNVEWVSIRHNVFPTVITCSSFPYLCLSPSSSSGKQHITLIDSSNHSTVFAWQVENVTDTQLIGVRKGGERGKKLNRTENPPCMTTPPSFCHPHSPRLHSFSSSSPSFSIIFPILSFPFFHKIRFDSKSPWARQMTDNPSQFYH